MFSTILLFRYISKLLYLPYELTCKLMLKSLITGSLDIRQQYGSQYTIHISVNRPIFERLQIIHHGTNNSNHAQIL